MRKDIYELAKDLNALADKVITEHKELSTITEHDIRIGYIRSSKRNRGKGKIIFADTRKVNDVYSVFVPYDFLITFYMPNVEMLDEEQFEILMWHELKHCGVDERGNLYVVPHDIEDFTDILEKHGLHWTNSKQVGGEAELDED